jgi:transposase
MQKPHDDSKACLTAFVQHSTLTVVIEMSLANWLVAGMIPGVDREPRKKIAPNPEVLLLLLYRWRDEAIKAGKEITRIAVAYETGRDGFWLARWLRARGIDANVIHATSVAVSREHRRAKTDRIDTAMLQRGFLGWLRGERGHCSMAIVPTVAEEDGRCPHREREILVKQRTSTVNRMKSILIQFGVRNFNPVLRKAPEKLESVRTPREFLCHPMRSQRFNVKWSDFASSKSKSKPSSGHGCSVSNEIPPKNSTLWFSCSCGSLGLVLRQPNNSCMRFCLAIYATARRWRAMRG